ncbi:hypothetical protein ACMD2_10780 [Ananas comosus]|uniref:Uncharacterized protein n=1 Tax=Ananas comosus TaxID=4615 RepID=A0A199VT10_ANACO|nr:hypothetical protein ACMD2_10780 [Ananas comosus]
MLVRPGLIKQEALAYSKDLSSFVKGRVTATDYFGCRMDSKRSYPLWCNCLILWLSQRDGNEFLLQEL